MDMSSTYTNSPLKLLRKNIASLAKRGIRRIVGKPTKIELYPVDEFLRDVSGVVHVGANTGQEWGYYFQLGLRVVWVEPNPGVFQRLQRQIADSPKQQAFKYLLADQDDRLVPFHIANNDGLSSSMLDLKQHRDIWPQVTFDKTIELPTCTLDTMFRRERISPKRLDALVMDTQGSELMILSGGESFLRQVHYVKVEVADFEAYEGCCQVVDIERFLSVRGFKEFARELNAEHPGGGRYYDIVYVRDESLTKRWSRKIRLRKL
jgi:FkbM family methyltransferase